MKTRLFLKRCTRSGYALLMVMVIIAVSLLLMASTLNRTYTVANLNNRSNQLLLCQNAAEAAVEKVFARMQYDFQSGGGPATVSGNVGTPGSGTGYQASYPNEDPFWSNFQFSDGNGHNNATYVAQISTYTGTLPAAYPGRNTASAPVYRIMSNAQWLNGSSSVVGTCQEDVMLALVPLTTYAIFYNGLLEFSTCATMTVNGPVHCNTNIYVGTSASLLFNTMVTASGTISAPANNGSSWGNAYNFNSAWNTTFAGTPTNYVTNIATLQLALPMTNTHSIIDMPITNDYSTTAGSQRLYNQAQVVLLVSNTTVNYIVQQAPNASSVSAADPAPYKSPSYGTNVAILATNLPFLTLTNLFFDGREQKTNLTTQIDVGQYATWMSTNVNILGPGHTKFTSGTYPTILYVADNRTVGAHQLAVVRLTNGIAPPSNGAEGWSVATPNPLYVWGNYNQTNASFLATTNTSAGTVPCALMSDSLTILSTSFNDHNSLTSSFSQGAPAWDAATNDTVNAAIVTGIVPSTGSDSSSFSGGVHNLPRLLEDWGSSTLWLNTSIINLYNSTRATNKFVNPGFYYEPPTRKFSYDLNFSNPNKVPPGIPNALVALRYDWAVPPPGTTNYNVVP
jgi:hypothetical protein